MQPGYGYGYGPPQGYASAPGYGMPPQQPAYGYGAPGGPPPRPRSENTAEDLDRIARTIHVGGIRGLKGTPGVNPGEEITEDDLAAFFGNDTTKGLMYLWVERAQGEEFVGGAKRAAAPS